MPLPLSPAVNNDGATVTKVTSPLIIGPVLETRSMVASPVARPAGSTALTWLGVTTISPIGAVFPELSVMVALTPPKAGGKGAGGPPTTRLGPFFPDLPVMLARPPPRGGGRAPGGPPDAV